MAERPLVRWGHQGRAARFAAQWKRNWRPLLLWAGIWHRRHARLAWRWHQPHEHLLNSPPDPSPGRLYQRARPRSQSPRRGYFLWFAPLLPPVCRGSSVGAGRQQHQSLPLCRAAPHPHPLLCSAGKKGYCRHYDNSQPQSQGI